jgi:molybdopterin converting factor small subunit
MSIVLYLSRNLTGYTKGAEAFEVDGETVGECLNDFVNIVPPLKDELFLSSDDRLNERVQVKVNRKIVDPENRLTKRIKDGDEIEVALKGQ